jgi:hypothetical protein
MTLIRDIFFKLMAVLLAATMTPLACRAQAATFLVGGDNCDFSNIQSAINAAASHPGPDTIRVAMNANYTAQALKISNQELTITGGFATCSSAAPIPGATTTISGLGGAADSVIEVLTSTVGNLRFENLLIRDGDESGDSGGGGIDFQSQGTLTLNNVIVANNRSGYGGGIYFEGANGPSTLTFGPNTVVQNNIAENSGGGVRISGDALFNMLRERTTVTNNEAQGMVANTGYGGGVQIVPPARAEIASSGLVNFGAISNNRAKYGGGLALTARNDGNERGLTVLYSTDPMRPIRVDHNIASVAGGGVYVDTNRDLDVFETSYLCAYEFRIDHNQAPDGAALFLGNDTSLGNASGATVNFNIADQRTVFLCGVSAMPPRPSAVFCASDVPCNSIDANIVAQTNGQAADGAVIEITEDAELRANRVALIGNRGSDVIHTLTTKFDGIELSNILIADNVLTARAIASDARVNFLNLTITGNTLGFADVMRLTNNILLRDSIIWQPGKQSLGSPHGALEGSAVLTNDPASLPIPGAFNLPPRFIDPALGNYRLRAASPAIDVSAPEPDPLDLDGLTRHQDLPVPDGFGPRDLGAYERQSIDPLVINSDFFTDLALWNQVTPGVSSFDLFENAPGASGSGSGAMRFDYQASDIILSRVTARTQCIHLPLTGTYKLNSFARTTGSFPPSSVQTALLRWEFRRDGGEACNSGVPDRAGDLRITSGSAWATAFNPAVIAVTPDQFTRNSSISVSTVMVNDGITVRPSLSGWFDRITLILDSDRLFANGFE